MEETRRKNRHKFLLKPSEKILNMFSWSRDISVKHIIDISKNISLYLIKIIQIRGNI